MKVILMAAGRGTRISKYIGDIPKSLVDIGGETLISHTIEMLQRNGIKDISIIVGYKHEQIEEELKGKNVKIYYNPFFAVTNSIGSLWLAQDELTNDDIILANADVFWEDNMLKFLMSDDRDVVMLSDIKRVDDGDFFFNTNEDNRIIGYGKELGRDERTCEYVGVAKIDKNYVSQFKSSVLQMVSNGDYDKWWENALYSLIDEKDIYAKDVEGMFWAEVDFIEDYQKIKNYYSEHCK